MAHLEIKHLRMIEMITRTKNLTRAAESLYVTQSALSQQLIDIEEKLGAAIFYRTGKKMILTRIGKGLLDRARVIIDEIEQAEQEVDRAVNGEDGELKIGVRCLFCYMWLPEVLTKFQRKYPNVNIIINNSIDPEHDLIAEKYDIAISATEKIGKPIAYSPLFRDEMRCVMSVGHRLSAKRFLKLKDFHGADIISLIEKSKHAFYQTLLFNRGIKLRRFMTIAHPEAMIDLISAGLGIGILPKWFIAPYVQTKEIYTCPLTAKGTYFQWKATYLKAKHTPLYLKAFIRIITAHAITNKR